MAADATVYVCELLDVEEYHTDVEATHTDVEEYLTDEEFATGTCAKAVVQVNNRCLLSFHLGTLSRQFFSDESNLLFVKEKIVKVNAT